MADTTAPTEPAEPKTVEPTGGEPATGDPADALGDAGKKALDAERTARRAAEKRAADLAAQIKDAEANAAALKKAQARIAAYEHRDRVTAWKTAAAKASGVPVDALRGDTEEEITSHAEVLKGILSATPVVGGTGISGKAPESGTPNAALQAVRNLFGTK